MDLKLFLVACSCMLTIAINAQQLVPNNSFEEYSSLPDAQGQWDRCTE